MIDLPNLDPEVSPLVDALLDRVKNGPADSLGYEYALSFDEERQEFVQASLINLNRAYGDGEPDYTDVAAYTTRNGS